MKGFAQHGNLLIAQLERGGNILPRIGFKGFDAYFLDPLQRGMEHDEGGTGIALELQDHGVVPHHTHRGEIHRHLLAALRAAHLLADPQEDLLKSVRVKLHHDQYTMERFPQQKAACKREPLRYTAPMPARSPVKKHTVAALVAVAAVVVFAQGTIRRGSAGLTAQVNPQTRAEIGVEHILPLTLSLMISTNGRNGIADLAHDGTGTAHVSLPSSWTRREVRGTPLATVIADPPTFGFTRWSLPAGATVSFSVPVPPSTILLHNPSGVPLQIKLTRVDLATQEVERDVILVQDATTELW